MPDLTLREALAQPISAAATYMMTAATADPDPAKATEPLFSTTCADAPESEHPPLSICRWSGFLKGAADWAADVSRQHGDVKLLGGCGRPDPDVLMTDEGSVHTHLQSVLLLRVQLVFKSGAAGFQPLSYTRQRWPGGGFTCVYSWIGSVIFLKRAS